MSLKDYFRYFQCEKRAISIFLILHLVNLVDDVMGFRPVLIKCLKKKTNLVREREVGEVACLNMDC